MSHVCVHTNPDLMTILNRCHDAKDYDELLDCNTVSKPAVWCRSSQTLSRIHLHEDDPRLEECKRQIREIKQAIKAQLIEEFGEETWSARMPFDKPLIHEQPIVQ